MKKPILILSILLFPLACEKVKDVKLLTNENKVSFCSMIDYPKKYESKIIQTKAIVLGFHHFIFYNNQCLEQSKVTALEMNYESRRKLTEAIQANKVNYKTNFLNNNLYAEITVSGELRENNDKEELGEFHPKYKFFVNEINNVHILSEEIFPSNSVKEIETLK